MDRQSIYSKLLLLLAKGERDLGSVDPDHCIFRILSVCVCDCVHNVQARLSIFLLDLSLLSLFLRTSAHSTTQSSHVERPARQLYYRSLEKMGTPTLRLYRSCHGDRSVIKIDSSLTRKLFV